ncbi:MAG: hypothetical protein EXR91_12835 [Gemmatimonadetes bacterium]|nr:hypothetical protein [Gemmatimonadota bacterium]
MRVFVQHPTGSRARGRGPGLLVSALAPLLALSLAACEGLLDVDLPGNVVAADLSDPVLAETLVLSAQGDFDCGLTDMWYPGQWFEEFQNTSQGRPNALAGLRSALLQVYADPCSSGTGPIWTPLQLPRQQAKRAIDLINGFPAFANRDFLVAKSRLYEGYSIQILGEQFCAVTFDGGPLITRAQAYDSAEVKFTDAIALASASITAGVRVAEATAVRNAAYVGRARARLYQWQYSGGAAKDVIDDASLVPLSFRYEATYLATPSRNRNKIFEYNNNGGGFQPWQDYTNLRIAADGRHFVGTTGGVADPRVPMTYGPDLDPRGFTGPYRRQRKFIRREAPIPFATGREALLMIAEVNPAQSVAIVNQLRGTSTGMYAGTPNSGIVAWTSPLPTISAATAAAMTATQIRDLVREERRRELWMQGTHGGDKIRLAYPAWDAADEFGGVLRDVTSIDDPVTPGVDGTGCIPIPFLEVAANPNI